MLFIHGSLGLGGIETFYVRMAKERKRQGKVTKILLISNKKKNNPELLSDMNNYAEVYFYEDIFTSFPFFGQKFPLMAGINEQALLSLMNDVSQIHVSGGEGALIAKKFISEAKASIPQTVGIYHSLEFSWGNPDEKLPYYEKINREFVLTHVPSSNIFCFAQSTKDYLQNKLNVDIGGSKTFRLGVVDDISYVSNEKTRGNLIRICTVGRLVDFKTYNIWMLDVVFELKKSGHNVVFDLFGYGPLENLIQEKIKSLGLSEHVRICGALDYDKFNKTVEKYDLFIGSGTAIIQSASLGVASIIGIESIQSALSYGFFSDFAEYEYHNPHLPFDKADVSDILIGYINLTSQQRRELSNRHIDAAKIFSVEACNKNFETSLETNFSHFKYNSFLYCCSKMFHHLEYKFKGESLYKKKRTI